MEAASVAAATAAAAAPLVIAPPGFQTGANGKLMANGKPFVIKGVNWWGTEGSTRTFGGLKSRSMDSLLDFIEEQGFNAIRILLNHRGVMINGKIPASEFDEGRTPALVNVRYLDQIETMVRVPLSNRHRRLLTCQPRVCVVADAKGCRTALAGHGECSSDCGHCLAW